MPNFFNKYPYTDFHELNLDYVLSELKKMQDIMDDFIAGNKITFADPIRWDISKSYQANTVVLNDSGNAYISLREIPTGISLNNTEYWMEVFDFTGYITKYDSNMTVHLEFNTDRATRNYAVGDWTLIDNILYKVTQIIPQGATFVLNTNIQRITIEQVMSDWITSCTTLINDYKDDIDESEAAYRTQLAQDIADITDSLQAQLDAAISGVTVDSELINARIAYNGNTYSTAGNAIRDQVDYLHGLLNKYNLFTWAQKVKGHVMNAGTESAYAGYDYYIVNVVSGTTYVVGQYSRFISTSNANISGTESHIPIIFTASASEPIYVTVRSDSYEEYYDKMPFMCELAEFYHGTAWRNERYLLQNILNDKNLLTSAAFIPCAYQRGGYTPAISYAASYCFYVIHVENGTEYTISPGCRRYGSESSVIWDSGINPAPITYTATYTGNLYLTFSYDTNHDYYVCKTSDLYDGCGWLTNNLLANGAGNSATAPISQAAASALTFGSKIAGKKILNLGDSIAETRVGSKSYALQLSEDYGAILDNDQAVGGATLSLTADQGARSSIYQQVVDTITAYPSADYDIILIDGGTNDYGLLRTVGTVASTGGAYKPADYDLTFDETTIIGAFEGILKMLRSTYTNAIIVFVTPHKNDRCSSYYYSIMDGLREACYKWSIPVADIDKYGQLNTRIPAYQTTTYSDGGTHPNTLGTKMFYVPNILMELMRFF